MTQRSRLLLWPALTWNLVPAVDQQVAFSAALTDSGSVGPFDQETTLVFSKMFSNAGSAYNQSTGDSAQPVRRVRPLPSDWWLIGQQVSPSLPPSSDSFPSLVFLPPPFLSLPPFLPFPLPAPLPLLSSFPHLLLPSFSFPIYVSFFLLFLLSHFLPFRCVQGPAVGTLLLQLHGGRLPEGLHGRLPVPQRAAGGVQPGPERPRRLRLAVGQRAAHATAG